MIQLTKINLSDEQLSELAEAGAYGVGADKHLIIENDGQNHRVGETDFVSRAHRYVTPVHKKGMHFFSAVQGEKLFPAALYWCYLRSKTLFSNGLKVHIWTSRNENQFLLFDYGADVHEEFKDLIAAGVDGIFTDYTHSLFNFLAPSQNTCN